MPLPDWYNIQQIARDCHRKNNIVRNGLPLMSIKKHRSSSVNPIFTKGRLLLAVSILMLVSAAALYSVNVHLSGESPTQSNSHPPLPDHVVTPLITSSQVVLVSPGSVSVGTIGSTFTIQVKVQNMDQFNGWDIRVYAAPWVINATSLSISGNDFAVNASSGSAFEIVHCVNGVGTGCTSSDGPGFVHSSYGNTAVLSGNGLLFTITYQVKGNAALSPLWYGYSPISLLNDLISSPSSGNGVQHTTLSGIYGIYPSAFAGGGGGSTARRD